MTWCGVTWRGAGGTAAGGGPRRRGGPSGARPPRRRPLRRQGPGPSDPAYGPHPGRTPWRAVPADSPAGCRAGWAPLVEPQAAGEVHPRWRSVRWTTLAGRPSRPKPPGRASRRDLPGGAYRAVRGAHGEPPRYEAPLGPRWSTRRGHPHRLPLPERRPLVGHRPGRTTPARDLPRRIPVDHPPWAPRRSGPAGTAAPGGVPFWSDNSGAGPPRWVPVGHPQGRRARAVLPGRGALVGDHPAGQLGTWPPRRVPGGAPARGAAPGRPAGTGPLVGDHPAGQLDTWPPRWVPAGHPPEAPRPGVLPGRGPWLGTTQLDNSGAGPPRWVPVRDPPGPSRRKGVPWLGALPVRASVRHRGGVGGADVGGVLGGVPGGALVTGFGPVGRPGQGAESGWAGAVRPRSGEPGRGARLGMAALGHRSGDVASREGGPGGRRPGRARAPGVDPQARSGRARPGGRSVEAVREGASRGGPVGRGPGGRAGGGQAVGAGQRPGHSPGSVQRPGVWSRVARSSVADMARRLSAPPPPVNPLPRPPGVAGTNLSPDPVQLL